MKEARFKIELICFDTEVIRIMDRSTKLYWMIEFSDFEPFAKQVYASYKKYKYVLKRGDKDGIKKNTH